MTPSNLPPRPRLIFRIGFAGRKDLDSTAAAHLSTQLKTALQRIGQTLAAIAPGVPVQAGQEPKIARFYARERPLLRLVTGLCEGADALAAEVLHAVRVAPDAGCAAAPESCLETELATVLPFGVADYRASRPVDFLPTFDAQLQRCAYVLELDGVYQKPNPDTALAKKQRARAYRAQSAFLLRHADLVIAAANPDDAAKAGGTLETLRAALAFDLPALLIHTGSGAVYLIEPDDDLNAKLAEPAADDWPQRLATWVRQIAADPDLAGHEAQAGHPHPAEPVASPDARLEEFFDQAQSPDRASQRWGTHVRKWAWSTLESRFATGAKPKSDPALEPYASYRKRATALNYHYSGLYRGAFVLNYGLAVLAVLLATLSLMLLGSAGHTAVGEQVMLLLQATTDKADVVSSKPAPWLLPLLLGLAACKLGIVVFISRNTKRANRECWNDRAVDMRFLAERLRALFYLPRLGSFQPPAVYPPQFASRVVRQSRIDWLCEALVRGISPAQLTEAARAEVPRPNSTPLVVQKLLRVDAKKSLEMVRDQWVAQQGIYHERNYHTMHGLHEAMEHWQKYLGYAVIVVVILDLLLIGGKLAHKLQWIALPASALSIAKFATPILILISAVLPAVIAALGGLRFQSECQRLAERSLVMRRMLTGANDLAAYTATNQNVTAIQACLAQAQGRHRELRDLYQLIEQAQSNSATTPPSHLGSYAHEALRLSERIAEDFVQEAAEWSVLYAKDLGDPG